METKSTKLSTLVKRFNIPLSNLCSIIYGLGFEIRESPNSIIPNELVSQIENELDSYKEESGINQTEPVLMLKGVLLNDDIKRRVATIIEEIQDVILPTMQGKWVLMANISKVLDENGLYFREYGYNRLKPFLDENEYLKIFTDTTKRVPRHFVQSRISKKTVAKISGNSVVTEYKGKDVQDYSHENFFAEGDIPNLMRWAWFKDWPSAIGVLKETALKENWGNYIIPDTGIEKYPVLESYFSNTFVKCWRERKVILSKDGLYSAFHTGLVDYKYDYIFAMFSRNRKKDAQQPWYFDGFCVEGEGDLGKILVSKFSAMPSRAEYFKKTSDILYDTTQEEPKLNSKHIIVDNIDRLPYGFVKMNAPEGFNLLSPEELDEKTKDMEMGDKEKFLANYYNSLRDAVHANPDSFRRMLSGIKDAMNIAIKRVGWNYKSAIPMYWIRGDKMCLFLPLCLARADKVDIALVVNKTESNRYQGETIYRLDWAYKCARLVCKPESDWLPVPKLTNQEEDSPMDPEQPLRQGSF